jgi:TolA-binding protein
LQEPELTKKSEEKEKKTTKAKTTRKKTTKKAESAETAVLERLEARLESIESRLTEMEQNIKELQGQAIPRSDWVDLSARLDIVEQNTNKTLGKVRNRLDTFTREVRQIAVVPEKELNEMFELVRLVRRYLAPEKNSNR